MKGGMEGGEGGGGVEGWCMKEEEGKIERKAVLMRSHIR